MHSPQPPKLPSGFYALRGNAALALAKRGYRIFPLIPGAKTPAIAKWREHATSDSATIIKWWSERGYNIGVACGESADGWYLTVLDYDMKDGQQGQQALDHHELLELVLTAKVKTPNGVHKYYKSRKPIRNSQSRVAPNVDVRGVGGYVVGVGSVIEGVEYRWLDESPAAELPDNIERLAIGASDQPATTTGSNTHNKQPIGELDQPDAIQRAVDYLKDKDGAPEAITGSHGDATTFQVACRVKDFGISEAECLDLMLNNWNDTKAHEPWPFDALRTKVRNAYAYGRNAPGSARALNEFPVENSESIRPQPAQQGLFRISYRDRVNKAGKTHGNPLIKGLIKRGTLNVLYGPSNSGKTFVAMDMAFAIATGQDWNGRKTTKGLVVYVAAEGGAGINERTKALDMVRKPGTDPHFDVVPCPIDLLRGSGPESHTSKLIALIKDAERDYGQGCVLVVIDTLSRALAGGEENSSVDMGTFIKHLDLIKHATGAALLIIHHSGKDIARGARGWSGVLAAIDTEMEIFENTFTNTKQRDLSKIEDVGFQLETIEVGTDEDGDPIFSCVMQWGAAAEFELELAASEQRLFDVLMASDLQNFNMGELRAYLEKTKDAACAAISGWDESVLRERLGILVTKRKTNVWKVKRGRWGLKPETSTKEKDR